MSASGTSLTTAPRSSGCCAPWVAASSPPFEEPNGSSISEGRRSAKTQCPTPLVGKVDPGPKDGRRAVNPDQFTRSKIARA